MTGHNQGLEYPKGKKDTLEPLAGEISPVVLTTSLSFSLTQATQQRWRPSEGGLQSYDWKRNSRAEISLSYCYWRKERHDSFEPRFLDGDGIKTREIALTCRREKQLWDSDTAIRYEGGYD